MTTCSPRSVGTFVAHDSFSFYYSVDTNVSLAIPAHRMKQPVISFVDPIVSHTSSRNNILLKFFHNKTDEYHRSIQVFDSNSKEPVVQHKSGVDRLDQIAALEHDWNGYGAKEFSNTLIEKCKRIINYLPKLPDIYPTGRQSIQLQYELDDRSYLEFEVFETKTVYLQVPKRVYSAAITDNFVVDEIDRIKEIVCEFYGLRSDTR